MLLLIIRPAQPENGRLNNFRPQLENFRYQTNLQ